MRVQYTKTEDGVDIAYAVFGEGPPLVVPPNLSASHLQLSTGVSTTRAFYERLSRRLQLICYDPRGVGMSQRDCVDFSVEAQQRDLVAVVDRVGLERFALYTHTLAGDGPMAFAASHPERVTCLAVWVGQTIRDFPSRSEEVSAARLLADVHWDLFTRVMGRVIFGWDSDDAAAYATLLRESSSPDAIRAIADAIRIGREAPSAPAVRAPALIAHAQGADLAARAARALAARMPLAHVLSIPGVASMLQPYVYDNEVLLAAIADFVETAWRDPAAANAAPALNLSAMRAILWTDIEDHTPLMQRLGDDRGRDVLRDHERITRDALAEHGGTEVKAMGDGFMAWFPSAQQALSCAVALQRAFAARNSQSDAPLRIRAGVNAGEPIVEDDDLFGSSVIAAARICREAEGGEVVVSDVVRQLVTGKGFRFEPHGETMLKGFDEPIRLHRVRWE